MRTAIPWVADSVSIWEFELAEFQVGQSPEEMERTLYRRYIVYAACWKGESYLKAQAEVIYQHILKPLRERSHTVQMANAHLARVHSALAHEMKSLDAERLPVTYQHNSYVLELLTDALNRSARELTSAYTGSHVGIVLARKPV